jgi:hypothetical protein
MTDAEINALDRRQGNLETQIAVVDTKLDTLGTTLTKHIADDEIASGKLFKFLAIIVGLNAVVVIENIDKLAIFIKAFI